MFFWVSSHFVDCMRARVSKKKKKNTSLCVKTRCCHHHTQFSFLRSSEMCFGGLHLRTCEKPGTHRRGAKNSGLNDFPLIRCLKVNDSGRINDTSAHVGSCFFPSDPCFFFFSLMRDIPWVEDFWITVFSSRLKPHWLSDWLPPCSLSLSHSLCYFLRRMNHEHKKKKKKKESLKWEGLRRIP